MNQFESLTKIATEAASGHGFTLRSPFCDRHGSWEIVFHKADGGLDRFVSLALSSRYSGDELRWLIELYVMAEDERFSERELNASFLMDANEFDPWIDRAARDTFESALKAAKHLNPMKWRRDLLFASRPEIAEGAGALGR